MRQEKVEIAIAVVVEERRGNRVGSDQLDAGTVRFVEEGAIAVLEHVVAPAFHGAKKQVEIAIAVDIAEGRPAALVGDDGSHFLGGVDESTVALVLVKTVGVQVAAHHVQVDVPIPVVVSRSDTAAESFRHGQVVELRPVRPVESGVFNLHKDDFRRRRRRRRRRGRSWRRRWRSASAATAAYGETGNDE